MSNMPNQNVHISKDDKINWEFFNNLPLIATDQYGQGVLDLLGVQYQPHNKKFVCLEHNDSNPSACVYGDNNQNYKCFSCGASGTALNLVSVSLNLTAKEAAYFLDKYYPGGIEKSEKSVVVAPMITNKQLNAIGLRKSPLSPVFVKNLQTTGKKGFEKFCIETDEAVGMLIDKLGMYMQQNLTYLHNIFQNFPEIPPETKRYMIDKVNRDIDWSDSLIQDLRKYAIEVAQINTPELLEDVIEQSIREMEQKEERE